MERNNLVDLLKRISDSKFNNQNESNVSKALGFYFLKRFIENDFEAEDYWNCNVDSSNDRGFDFVFFDDSSESSIKAYFIQCKYSENGNTSIDENEVSKTINNFNDFPLIQGNLNPKLESKINEFHLYQQKESVEIEKIGIYVNLGNFTTNSRESLERAHFEVYDFERFNSELLLDEKLPDISITLKKPSLDYDENNFLAILSVKEFLNSPIIREYIVTQKIFHYNVRGLMRNKKNSIADDIRNTAMLNPEKLFQRNNGLTIICKSFTKDSEVSYTLNQASIINGQQTIRALMSIWGTLNEEKKSQLSLTVKVLGIKIEDNILEILNVAKASNKQNSIKESDLFANEPAQKAIEEKSILLPEAIRYKYLSKRTIQFPEESKEMKRLSY